MSAEPRVLSGRYRIDELIGRGGMASVYRGQDLTLGRAVAIKILNRDLAADNAFRTRFRLEAQAASRMSHPSIVRVYDAGEDSETDADGTVHPVPYIVMELVHGKLLKDLAGSGPMPMGEAVRYVDGILEALAYSHRAGVVHRDIKPGNVMVTDQGQIKVMDFGIARAVSDSSSTVAETTAILGTAAYFSPEQAKGEPVDGRADLYSTGVVLYELLAGRQPFRGDTPVAVAYQHVSETPVAPSELVDTVPLSMDAVVLRALAKDPYQRYQDAASFREALDATVDGRTPTKRQLGALTSELYGANPRQAAETARSLRQLSTDTTMRRTQAGPPVAWIWTGVAVLTVVLVSVLIWVLTARPGPALPSDSRIVPDVVEMTWERAGDRLAEEDLQSVRVEETSDKIAPGDVIRTDPATGTAVSMGQEIRVYVSTGQQMATVPTLVALTLPEATNALAGAGLQLGTVRSVNDPTLARDVVVSANSGPGRDVVDGEQLPVGARVNLVVASGSVTLVNLKGYSTDGAISVIEGPETQLVAIVNEARCTPEEGAPGTVSAQSAIGEVPVGSEVTITVCTAG